MRSSLLPALALTACVLAAPPARADESAAAAYLADGQQYLAKGDIRSAAIQLKNAVRANPANGEARRLLGSVFLRLGEPGSAEKEFKAARERGIPEEQVAAGLAQALVTQNRGHELSTVVPRGNRPPEIEGEIALWYAYHEAGSGRLDPAMAAFRDAAALMPDDPRPHVGMAQLLAQTKDLAGAAAAAEEGARRAGTPFDRGEALAIKAEIKRMAGDAAEAERLFAEALLADPGNRIALVGRATMALAAGKPDEAERDARAALAAAPSHPVAIYVMAAIQSSRQQIEAALETLQNPAVEQFPPAQLLRANLHFQRNELEQALEAVERYRQRAGNDPRGQRLLGSILLRQRQTDKAVAVLKAAAEAAPDDPQVIALLGAAYLQQGDHANAAKMLDRAMEMGSADPDMLSRLAIGQLQLGDTADAIAALKAASDQDGDALQARLLLVLAYLRGGNFDEALAAAKDMRSRMPDSPMPYNMEGGVHLAKKDFSAARAAFEQALARKGDYAPALLNMGRLSVQDGDLATARRYFARAADADSRSVHAYMGLADVETRESNPKAAMSWLDKAAAAVPEALPPRLGRIELMLRQNEAQKALLAARELVQAHPDQPQALQALAKAQWTAGEQSSAIATLRRVAELSPRSAAAQVEVARALVHRNDPAAAQQALERALKIDPGHLPAHAELIGLALRSGRQQEALRLAQSWRERHPDNVTGDLLVADVLIASGRVDQAVPILKGAAGRPKGGAAMIRLAQLLIAAGRGGEALAMAGDWLKAAPAVVERRALYAHVLLQLRRYDEAQGQFEQVVAAEGDNASALNNLAWLYARKGDARALALADKAHRLAPSSPEIADTLGWILVRGGQVERGLPLIEKAYASLKTVPDVRYHLAVALDAAGRKDEARKILDTLVGENAEFEDASAARQLHDSLSR